MHQGLHYFHNDNIFQYQTETRYPFNEITTTLYKLGGSCPFFKDLFKYQQVYNIQQPE